MPALAPACRFQDARPVTVAGIAPTAARRNVAFGKHALESLSAALEDFIAAQVKPVQRVALPPVTLPPSDRMPSTMQGLDS